MDTGMDSTSTADAPGALGLARVWAATLLSPLAWFLDLEVSLALSRTAAASDSKAPLFVTAALTLALAGVAYVWCRREWRLYTLLVQRGRTELAGARTVARWGMALGLFFMLLIAAMGVPNFVFTPRDLP
jgi:hypothetical protein